MRQLQEKTKLKALKFYTSDALVAVGTNREAKNSH
jgi:hypothetical protein